MDLNALLGFPQTGANLYSSSTNTKGTKGKQPFSSKIDKQKLMPKRNGTFEVNVGGIVPAGTQVVRDGLTVRLKYIPTVLSAGPDCCYIQFDYSDGEEWSLSDMTADEKEYFNRALDDLEKLCDDGKDIRSKRLLIIPPGISQRMAADPDYASYMEGVLERFSKGCGSDAGGCFLLDESGEIKEWNIQDLLKNKVLDKILGSEEEEDDFWKARAERQKEQIRLQQEMQMERRLETARVFAAQRGKIQDEKQMQNEERLQALSFSV